MSLENRFDESPHQDPEWAASMPIPPCPAHPSRTTPILCHHYGRMCAVRQARFPNTEFCQGCNDYSDEWPTWGRKKRELPPNTTQAKYMCTANHTDPYAPNSKKRKINAVLLEARSSRRQKVQKVSNSSSPGAAAESAPPADVQQQPPPYHAESPDESQQEEDADDSEKESQDDHSEESSSDDRMAMLEAMLTLLEKEKTNLFSEQIPLEVLK